MLARELKLRLGNLEVGETPMLIPSFSSRVNMDVYKLIEPMSETINETVLISAYDVFYSDNFPLINTDLVFIDSGGYECGIDNSISEIGYYRPEAFTWNEENYLNVIKNWPNDVPTVLISYDHPAKREGIEKQVEHAEDLFNQTNNILKEFLIKPEKINENLINLDSIIKNIDLLEPFDILGVTEKELGDSVFDRMITIAKLRLELDKRGLKIPLHIFGSLDPITTPLYYFSGADIFDGLSWLRFTFYNGNAFYTNSFGPILYGIDENTDLIQVRTFKENITYLLSLKLKLKNFSSSGNFDDFGPNADLFNNAYNDLKSELSGVI